MTRSDWDSYFLDLAAMASTRATCSRRQVGAVVVKDRRVQATGYNGSPPRYPHCVDGACPRAASTAPAGEAAVSYDLCIAVHAEANALLQCSPAERDGATIYLTDCPCRGCAKLIAASGIVRVVANANPYDDWPDAVAFLRRCGVRTHSPRLIGVTS